MAVGVDVAAGLCVDAVADLLFWIIGLLISRGLLDVDHLAVLGLAHSVPQLARPGHEALELSRARG